MSQLEIVERSSGFWLVDDEPVGGPFADYDQAHDALLFKTYQCVRVCLGPDGTVVYWPLKNGADGYGPEPLDSDDALHIITGCGVPIEIAANDPKDESTHHYEICQDEETNVLPGTTGSSITLCRV